MEKEKLLYHYFRGSLNPEELIIFNKLLEENIEFKAQFEFEKDVQLSIKDSKRNELKRKLQGFEIENKKQSVNKTTFWNPLRIAASIILLLGASLYFYSVNLSLNPEKLYASNYEKYPNTVYSITRGETTDNTLERKAFEAYENNNTKIAIGYFEELRKKSGLDYVEFYLAQTYLSNGDIQKALTIFEKIISEKTDFKTEALWYASLGHIKMKEEMNAMPYLEALIKDGSYKKTEAQKLLEKLN